MSVIVTFCFRDGIVMGADSRLTIYDKYTDGTEKITYVNGIKKIFQIKNKDIGLLWCGDYKVGDLEIPEFINEFSEIVKDLESVKDITEKLNKECIMRGYRKNIKWQVAGYENNRQVVYQIVDDVITQKNIDPEKQLPSICAIWDGQRGDFKQSLHCTSKYQFKNKLLSEKDIPRMTLEEGIFFTIKKLEEVCHMNKSCGEPINILSITTSGLKWV